MIDVKNDWLPIGSVVLLEGASHPVMITAYMAVEGSTKKIFDYCGCPFPEGLHGAGGLFFDKDQIEKVADISTLSTLCAQIVQRLNDFETRYQEARAMGYEALVSQAVSA